MNEVLKALGMTEEKAISILERLIAEDEDIDFYSLDEKMSFEMAISALSAEPCREAHRYDDYSKMRKYLKSIPSAFEGMTNGEVIKALFPEIDTHDFGITIHATERVTCCGDKHCRGSISYDFWKEWWNAPYKAESEDKE